MATVFALAKEENNGGASPTENVANAIEKKQENKVEWEKFGGNLTADAWMHRMSLWGHTRQ